jgi:hypothetical protein
MHKAVGSIPRTTNNKKKNGSVSNSTGTKVNREKKAVELKAKILIKT